jgi:hypothetical protein
VLITKKTPIPVPHDDEDSEMDAIAHLI